MWLNACSSGLSVASGISSVATLSTFISLPVGIPLGTMSLAAAGVSGIATVLSNRYQRKFAKVTKLTGIVTLALAMFETSVSKALNDHKIDEWESAMHQALYYKLFNPSGMKVFGTHTFYEGGVEPTPYDLENGRLYKLQLWQAIRTIYER